ncbi:MAG: hypothetical protein FK734_03385, partial [Asgard group archaeon]|nr:hypothetical protein [Asgard group archaeon]
MTQKDETPTLYQNYYNTNLSKELYVEGSTKFNLYSTSNHMIYFDPTNPSTFEYGISSFVGVLVQLSQFGCYASFDPYNGIFSQISVIKDALLNYPDCANQSSVCCAVLDAYHFLNRYDEIDIQPLVNCIKSHQLPDGGFLSGRSQIHPLDGNFSDLVTTFRNYFALKTVGEQPSNLSSIKEFIYSLQNTNESIPELYFFHQNTFQDPLLDYNKPSVRNTIQAIILLRELGAEVPFYSNIANIMRELVE